MTGRTVVSRDDQRSISAIDLSTHHVVNRNGCAVDRNADDIIQSIRIGYDKRTAGRCRGAAIGPSGKTCFIYYIVTANDVAAVIAGTRTPAGARIGSAAAFTGINSNGGNRIFLFQSGIKLPFRCSPGYSGRFRAAFRGYSGPVCIYNKGGMTSARTCFRTGGGCVNFYGLITC